MKLAGKQPRLLPDVLQAIVDLKESTGSTQHKILEHIQSGITAKKISPRPRNVTMQVRRALKHGVQNGLLTQKSGKFQLGIPPKDFAVYKIFRHMEPISGCGKCKKGRSTRRRKRRRRRKRSIGDKYSDTDFSKVGTPEPMDASRRRRGRKRRRRRRRGRRRTYNLKEINSESDQTRESPKSSREIMLQKNKYGVNDDRETYDSDDCIIGGSQDDFKDSYVN